MSKSKIKLGLAFFTLDAKIAFVQQVIESINESASLAGVVDTTPLQTALDELIAARTDRDAAYSAAKAKTPIVYDKDEALDNAIKATADEVEDIANGDESIMESGGFQTFIPGNSSPVGVPAQVQNLSAVPGVADGTIALNWNSVFGANSYNVYISTNPANLNSYSSYAVVTASEAVLTGLTKGTNYWIRIAAVGAAGEGPLSDPASSVAR